MLYFHFISIRLRKKIASLKEGKKTEKDNYICKKGNKSCIYSVPWKNMEVQRLNAKGFYSKGSLSTPCCNTSEGTKKTMG